MRCGNFDGGRAFGVANRVSLLLCSIGLIGRRQIADCHDLRVDILWSRPALLGDWFYSSI